ncbi:hypothetical protein F2Q69_00006633 [Brassica cretica]|uniref:Uncharacterized protein n=1 Tax=Brassica cretica TaxID=69181 RepID=A0A8S9PC86_BRACR|nr:hypothetical protein F2Q69_00006633 [Brassica cretica]
MGHSKLWVESDMVAKQKVKYMEVSLKDVSSRDPKHKLYDNLDSILDSTTLKTKHSKDRASCYTSRDPLTPRSPNLSTLNTPDNKHTSHMPGKHHSGNWASPNLTQAASSCSACPWARPTSRDKPWRVGHSTTGELGFSQSNPMARTHHRRIRLLPI